jgi:hypothetical protein
MALDPIVKMLLEVRKAMVGYLTAVSLLCG